MLKRPYTGKEGTGMKKGERVGKDKEGKGKLEVAENRDHVAAGGIQWRELGRMRFREPIPLGPRAKDSSVLVTWPVSGVRQGHLSVFSFSPVTV